MTPAAPIVLVGGFGRVGRMVSHHWPGSTVLRSQRGGTTADGAFPWAPLDGPKGLLDHLSATGLRPAALVMLAGVTPGPGVSDQAMAQNAQLATACLDAAHAAGISRVLLASSSAVYGVDPDGKPFSEATPAQPLSAYGRAKLTLEQIAHPWQAGGINVCALRIGNVAGADALLHPLATKTDKTPLRIDAFADGLGPLRSYIGAQTLARTLNALAYHPDALPAVLNIAAPAPVRMTALAKAADWPFRLTPAPETAHQIITLDCGLLERLIPFTAQDSQPAEMVRQWKATLA